MDNEGESILSAIFICAAIHVGFIGFGIEEALYDMFSPVPHAHDFH